jgi:RHS repeat-associated protein
LNVQTLTFLNQYDGLGRLSNQGISGTRLSTPVGWQSNFTYDPLGNVLQESSNASGTVNASLGYAAPDFDRICGLTYGTASTPQGPCSVGYDGVGNTVSMPTGTGSTRTLDYFPNGAVKHIGDGGSNANFTYDAFGALQQLNVDTTSADRRADKNFGSFIKQRIEGAQSVVNRRIPTPGGVIATLHGPMTGKWSFTFGDGHGTRFVTDQTGAYQQGVEYQPFGLASSPSFFPIKPSVGPGTTYYASEQWNGGDLLAAFGVVNLGARVYDPVIGRFLSRDPILQARNPYAFAGNDPINKSDPTGMFQECIFCDAGGAGDAPGGGGNTSPGGVLQNLGASGAGDPFGDRGFTQNGGTSASGMGGSGNAASGVGGSGNAALDAARSLFLSSYCGGSGGVCDFGPDEGVANFLFQLMGYLWPIEVVDPLPTREAAVDLSMPSTGGGPWAGRENTTGLQQVLDACNCMTPKAFKNWLIERRLISPVETKMIDFNTPPDPRVSQDKNDRRQGYRDPDATQGEYDAEYQTHEALRDTGAKYVGETTNYPWSGNPARTAPRADSFRNPAYIITPDPFGGKDIKTDLSPRTSTWFFQNPLGTGGQVNPLLMLSE